MIMVVKDIYRTTWKNTRPERYKYAIVDDKTFKVQNAERRLRVMIGTP